MSVGKKSSIHYSIPLCEGLPSPASIYAIRLFKCEQPLPISLAEATKTRFNIDPSGMKRVTLLRLGNQHKLKVSRRNGSKKQNLSQGGWLPWRALLCFLRFIPLLGKLATNCPCLASRINLQPLKSHQVSSGLFSVAFELSGTAVF